MSSTSATHGNGAANGGAGRSTTPTPDPLAFMTRLNQSVYIHRPSKTNAAEPAAPAPAPAAASPRLILMCTWMGAHPMHISKYVKPYTKLYPHSAIVLVRSEMRHFVRPGTIDEIKPAVDAIRAEFSESMEPMADHLTTSTASTSYPPLLVHVWSNGGSNGLCHIARRLPPLPPYTIVYDSTPGQFRYRSTVTALLAVLPPLLRTILAPAVHALCCWWWLRYQFDQRVLRINRDPLYLTAAAQNSPARLAREVRRSYIYSKEDALIDYRDVEAHAAEAKTKGADVRLELFAGTHVGHLRADPERYWRVVRETYAGLGSFETSKDDIESHAAVATPEVETEVQAASV